MSRAADLLDKLLEKVNKLPSSGCSGGCKCNKSSDVISTLKKELILTINYQVQKKPTGWMVRKKAFAEVLTMIKNIEGEV